MRGMHVHIHLKTAYFCLCVYIKSWIHIIWCMWALFIISRNCFYKRSQTWNNGNHCCRRCSFFKSSNKEAKTVVYKRQHRLKVFEVSFKLAWRFNVFESFGGERTHHNQPGRFITVKFVTANVLASCRVFRISAHKQQHYHHNTGVNPI